MKQYTVQFFYFTDCRACWTGKAFTESAALTKAVDEMLFGKPWCTEQGFHLKINCEGPA